jgi:hypothetical protein
MQPWWVGRMRVIEIMKHEAGVSHEAVDAAWQTLALVRSARLFNEINFTTTGVCVRWIDFCAMFLEECVFVWAGGDDKGAPIEYRKNGFEKIAGIIQERLEAYIINDSPNK